MNPILERIKTKIAVDGKTHWNGCHLQPDHLLCAAAGEIESLQRVFNTAKALVEKIDLVFSTSVKDVSAN